MGEGRVYEIFACPDCGRYKASAFTCKGDGSKRHEATEAEAFYVTRLHPPSPSEDSQERTTNEPCIGCENPDELGHECACPLHWADPASIAPDAIGEQGSGVSEASLPTAKSGLGPDSLADSVAPATGGERCGTCGSENPWERGPVDSVPDTVIFSDGYCADDWHSSPSPKGGEDG